MSIRTQFLTITKSKSWPAPIVSNACSYHAKWINNTPDIWTKSIKTSFVMDRKLIRNVSVILVESFYVFGILVTMGNASIDYPFNCLHYITTCFICSLYMNANIYYVNVFSCVCFNWSLLWFRVMSVRLPHLHLHNYF